MIIHVFINRFRFVDYDQLLQFRTTMEEVSNVPYHELNLKVSRIYTHDDMHNIPILCACEDMAWIVRIEQYLKLYESEKRSNSVHALFEGCAESLELFDIRYSEKGADWCMYMASIGEDMMKRNLLMGRLSY